MSQRVRQSGFQQGGVDGLMEGKECSPGRFPRVMEPCEQ